jgi:hypothetical protein
MTYLYLVNFGMYVIVGLGLLRVWYRYRQGFARDMGCSTLFASLLPIGYLIHSGAPPAMAQLGLPLVVVAPYPTCCSSVPA